MDITLGCSVDDLQTHPSYQALAVVNIENPLYPGYLDGDYRDDLAYLRSRPRQRLVLDGPYIDLNLGSPEPRARELAQEKVLQAIAFAEECRAEEIVFLSTFLPFIGLASYERGWVEESIRSWRRILEAVRRVPVSLGNTFEFDPGNLLEVVESVARPQLGLALDVGHCLVWGRYRVLDWYRQVKDRCRVVYLHSNDGRMDQHLSVRTGRLAELDVWGELRAELQKDSFVVLKYFDRSSAPADIEYLKSTLRSR